MAVAAVETTVLAYQTEEANLTSRLSSIMMRITQASQQSTQLLEQENEKKAPYLQKAESNSNYADTTEYKTAMDEINSDYELQLKEINTWESELEQQKNTLETQIKVVQNYKDSFTSVLKSNIKKDFSYGGSQGS